MRGLCLKESLLFPSLPSLSHPFSSLLNFIFEFKFRALTRGVAVTSHLPSDHACSKSEIVSICEPPAKAPNSQIVRRGWCKATNVLTAVLSSCTINRCLGLEALSPMVSLMVRVRVRCGDRGLPAPFRQKKKDPVTLAASNVRTIR